MKSNLERHVEQFFAAVRLWCVIAAIVSVLIVIVTCAGMASADAIEVIYRGTDVLEDGQPPFNVYYINCQPADKNTNTRVDIEIGYNDGTVEKRTGLYCNVKLFIDGSLHDGVIVHDDGTHEVEVIAAISSPETPPPTPAATATVKPTPQIVATSMPTQEPEERETKANIYLPTVMK